MLDQRLQQLNNWLQGFFAYKNFIIKPANNDASFRRYFRVQYKAQSLIAMDAPPDRENCNAFIAIGELLSNHHIRTPKVFAADANKGFMLLEDFGTTTLLEATQKSFSIKRYQYAIRMLIKAQSIKTEAMDFLPVYSRALLKQEMQLFVDWYLTQDLPEKEHKILHRIFDALAASATHRCRQVFVHRDYHARNLIVLGNRGIGVLDFQDAVIGSRNYDLCALLRDAYFELDSSQLQALLKYYYEADEVNMPFIRFKKQFDLMTLQRCLKILGIFSRLSKRDGKHQYLNHIPLVKKYALQVCHEYPEYQLLQKLI